MQDTRNPIRTPIFRLLTIGATGLGGFAIGLWGLRLGMGGNVDMLGGEVVVAAIAALCALAAAGSSFSFFAGVDESAGYVFRETQVDKLTGLLGRAATIGKIAEAAVATARTGQPVFMIDIDVDRFKQINDAIGDTQGDELVRLIAARMRETLPQGVEIGRIGAGEFSILLPDDKAGEGVDRLTDRLIEALTKPYQLSSHLQSVNLSVGIVAMPKDGTDPVLLMRRSNLALQHARAAGIGNWAVFQPHMGRVADHRQWVESELHTAFVRGDFELHYQPQHDLMSGRIVGYEALLRWRHPERGMIPPMEFVPIAEETGMIAPIGEWVLRRACTDARAIPDDCYVAVNISTVQFMTKEFLQIVRNIVSETGIAPRRLELEVTETAMMQDKERAAVILKDLSDMGISVAVDDFGVSATTWPYAAILDVLA